MTRTVNDRLRVFMALAAAIALVCGTACAQEDAARKARKEARAVSRAAELAASSTGPAEPGGWETFPDGSTGRMEPARTRQTRATEASAPRQRRQRSGQPTPTEAQPAKETAPQPALTGLAPVLQKYPRLQPEPFGKGIFAHVRAGGKIRGTPESIQALAATPYVAGTQLSYTWSELEPTEGNYRWDIIERDMDVWAQHGKKCWLEVSTAFRWDASGRMGVPEWVYQKGVPKIQAKGSAPYPVYWNPLYLEVWGRFVREMARKFDGDPRVEWVAVGGHTTGTEPRLSSKENDLVMDQWERAGFDGFKPDGVYLQKAILPIYRMFREAFHTTPVSATFIARAEFSDVMNREAAKMGFLLTNNGFGAKSAQKKAREATRARHDQWNTKIGYAEFGPSGRDSRFMDDNFKRPAGVTSVKAMRDEAHTAKLIDIYQRALGDDNDPALTPSTRLSYLPLSERAPRVETEAEWNAALKWAWEHLEK